MYVSLVSRRTQTLENLRDTILASIAPTMATALGSPRSKLVHLIDHQAPKHRLLSTTNTQVSSTASSPSLRSRESVVMAGQTGRSETPTRGGNVRVVVRVRGFLPRGV